MSQSIRAVTARATAVPSNGHAPLSIGAIREPKYRKFLTRFILSGLLCTLPCFGQNASVSGTVTDSTGAAIQRATVAFTNSNTNAVYQAATDDDGVYRVSGLVPGTYSATVSKPGFKGLVKPNIEIHVLDAISIAFTLPAGAVTETVSVEGGAPLLVTESTSLGQVIAGQQVQETPLNGRNVMNLIALVPGVIPQGGTQGSATGNQAAAGDFTNAFGWGNYQIGGGIAGQSQIFYDGATLNSSYGNTSNIVPTQDAIQEFRVSTNTLSPEFGATAGGVRT
jgi:Carboxypeptidase regulatory-like domain